MIPFPINDQRLARLLEARMPNNLSLPSMPSSVPGPVHVPGFLDKVMPSPEGMEGLLTPDDIKAAQKSGMLNLGASLLSNSGPRLAKDYVSPMAAVGQGIQAMQGAHQGALQSTMAMRMAADKAAMQKQAMQQAKDLPAARQAIIQKYPMPNVRDPRAMAQWIDTVLPHFIEVSDEETVARLSEIRKSIQGNQAQREPGHWMQVPGPDGKPRTIYAQAGQVPQGGIPTYEKPTRDAGAGLLDEQRMFTRANMLGDDYRSTTKRIAEAADHYTTFTSLVDQAKSRSPQAQIGLIFAYMKMLDPSSVVRESEYATAKNAAGVPERVRNQYNKLLEGSFLTPEQINGFAAAAGASAREWKRKQDKHIRTYSARARRWKIDPQDVTMDYFAGATMGMEPKGAPSGEWHPPMAPPPGGVGGGIVPRQPGESVADYLKRTRGQ